MVPAGMFFLAKSPILASGMFDGAISQLMRRACACA